MNEQILDDLLRQELLLAQDAEKIRLFEAKKPFSLHWELKALLYLGVVLLNAGLGYLIYENIESIGHMAVIALIGLVSAVCLGYAVRRRAPFSRGEVTNASPYYDYILLLGCLTFLIMEGYWQYQYQIFGERYGLATFIPMLLFFSLAYWLDNRAVLSLGITALGSWLGISVATNDLLTNNDLNGEAMVSTGILLGAFLTAVPFVSEHFSFKKHFSLTYLNFGVHVLMIACLTGLFSLDESILYFPLLCIAVGFYLWYARTRHSFYFLLVSVLYGYIGFTYLIFSNASNFDITFYMLYFIVSCVGIIVFLTQYKRFFKTEGHDSIQQ